jgi:rhodanese-related sulfurtransferase
VFREAAVVGIAGLLLGLAANALSPQGLRLGRNYFPRGSAAPAAVATNLTAGLPNPPATNAVTPAAPAGGVPEAVLRRLQQHGLQLVTSNDVARLFQDPRYEQNLIVFVDARDDAHYTAGHIPGAHQFNHYRAEQYLPQVLPFCLGALQIVVYCTGGQCEDSEFAALMLRDAGIPAASLFVYPGGMNEWTALGLPVELGPRRSGQLKPAPTAKP